MYKRILSWCVISCAALIFPSTASLAEEPKTISQTIRLYEGVLNFPPPIWVEKVKDFNNLNTSQNQDKNLFSLEQVPKKQSFENWSNLYGVYGFYLPEYDMKRFIDESLNALALGCKGQTKSKIVKANSDGIIMTYFCPDLRPELVVDGKNTESGFLYINQVSKSFAKVYLAWRDRKENMGTDKWPMNEETVTKAIQRLDTIRYYSVQQ